MLIRALKYVFGGNGLMQLPRRLEIQARMATAFSRAAATAAARKPEPTKPLSWEFSGFSQHGEDGIVDFLTGEMRKPNRYFVEIGSADGLQNCSAWLAYARRFGGVMVEGNPDLSRYCQRVLRAAKCHNVVALHRRVTAENVTSIMKACPYADPDVFIIDVDGIDYYIVDQVLAAGFRPKLLVVEYNSVFGPEMAVTVPYAPDFSRHQHASLLYYGVSIAGWRALLEAAGYEFVTVESNGTNAFFVWPESFPDGFADSMDGVSFLDNRSDRNGATASYSDSAGDVVVPARAWERQFDRIADLPRVSVPLAPRHPAE